MVTTTMMIEELANEEYKYGFVTEIESDSAPRGLSEDIVRLISAKKNEPDWMLEWRLKSYRYWGLEQLNKEPKWANIHYGPIDYQDIIYYSAPKPKDQTNRPTEIDPELLATFEKLGIPLGERDRLAGFAVDAVFDTVSVATTFKEKLAELGIIFCSFSECPACADRRAGVGLAGQAGDAERIVRPSGPEPESLTIGLLDPSVERR